VGAYKSKSNNKSTYTVFTRSVHLFVHIDMLNSRASIGGVGATWGRLLPGAEGDI